MLLQKIDSLVNSLGNTYCEDGGNGFRYHLTLKLR
jgi:hypothetical protein